MSSEPLIFLDLVLATFWNFLKSWYWLFLVLILWRPFLKFWFWWRYQNFWIRAQTPKIVEVILPADIVKPISAMELVLENMWKGFWEPAYFWEKWWQGKQDVFDFQFELVSDAGKIHFYIRTFLGYKIDVLKSAIYSQYPEAEFREVEDYSRAIPADAPNKDWDIRAGDFTLEEPDPYPINTYPNFEKEAEVITQEEKRVDPMAILLEAMADLKPGEQIWFQIKPFPIGGKYAKHYEKWGREIKDKIAQRKAEEQKSWFGSIVGVLDRLIGSFLRGIIEISDSIMLGKKTEEKEVPEKEKLELVAPELRMTPREREVCAAIERKISKSLFLVSTIRFVYLAKREVYNYHRWRRILEFMGSFCIADMNGFKTIPHTYTKITNPPPLNLFDKRRLYVRKRRILRIYQNRYEPKYPFSGDYKWGYFVLNTEELATVFHFPSRKVAPALGVLRVEAKKAEAPPEVPMEE